MKAAVLNRVGGGFQVEEIEIDAPRGHEVLVEIKASGLCHSDLHFEQQGLGMPLPAVLGHEIAGVVGAVGPDVTEFVPGDRVVATLVRSCGHCEECHAGHTWRCLNPGSVERGPDEPPRLSRGGEPVKQAYACGGFAERTLIHEAQLVKVPEALPFPQAAVLGCGCVTGAGAAINSADIHPGESVVVFGAGGIGLNVVSGARMTGAGRIIVVDMQPAKEALARKFGATDFLLGNDPELAGKVAALTGGGAHHLFDAVGNIGVISNAMRLARKGATIYLIGMTPADARLEVNVLADMIIRELTLKGVYMGSTNIKHDIPMYADLYLQGRFNLDDLVSQEIGLDQIDEAYAALENGLIARSVITRF